MDVRHPSVTFKQSGEWLGVRRGSKLERRGYVVSLLFLGAVVGGVSLDFPLAFLLELYINPIWKCLIDDGQ